MADILVFKTSNDATMKRLFGELQRYDNHIDCLIQTSQFSRYRHLYPDINFIDIKQEGFYDLLSEALNEVADKRYDQLYVTFSGLVGHNYGNVMSIVAKMDSRSSYFYNCNGDRVEIPKENFIKDFLCRIFICLISLMCGRKGER